MVLVGLPETDPALVFNDLGIQLRRGYVIKKVVQVYKITILYNVLIILQILCMPGLHDYT